MKFLPSGTWGHSDCTEDRISNINYKIQIREDDYSNQSFKNLTLYNSNIHRSNFNESGHINTIFNHVALCHSTFNSIVAPFIRFNYCTFDYADFSGSNLYGANFDLSRFERVNFTNCDLTKASFIKVQFHIVDFTNANLSDSVFSSVDPITPYNSFTNANFNGANLIGSNILKEFPGMYGNRIEDAKFSEDDLITLIDRMEISYKNTKCIMSGPDGIVQLPHIDQRNLDLIDKFKNQLESFTNPHVEEIEYTGAVIDIEEYFD